MIANETKLQQVLEGVKQFVVPLFQRPYTWGDRKEWDTLWNDIIEIYELDEPRTHFIGSIVNMPINSVPEGISKFTLIDGQQRLTTLIILLIAIRDRYIELNEKENADEINETLIVNKFQRKNGFEYYKVLPTQKFDDRDSFISIVNGEANNNENKIIKAYNFFIKNLKRKPNFDLQKLLNILKNNLNIVSITLDKYDNPYLVFESLNAKGTPLNPSDLIRNYLFMNITIEKQVKLFEDNWDPMERDLKDNLTEFIRHYLMINIALVNKSDVYFTLRRLVDNSNAESKLKDLNYYSQFYKKLIDPTLEDNEGIRKNLIRLNRIEVTTSYPLLLFFYNLLYENKINSLDFEKILYYLENFLIRRFISGRPSRELNKIFPSLLKLLSTVENNYVENFKKYLSSKGYPKDYEFKQKFMIMKFYGGADLLTKTKLILETIEQSFMHKELTNLENLTIEHILPQTITEEWKIELGEEWAEDHEIYKHQIGNLTLTAYNSEISNKSFKEKKDFFNSSHLDINKYFFEVNTWNKDSIIKRSNDLFEICNNIWPYFGTENIIPESNSFTNTTPKLLVFLDKMIEVQSWRDVLQFTLETLLDVDKEFCKNLNIKYPSYFSLDVNKFRDNRKLQNGIYYHVGLSATAIMNLCYRIIESAGYDRSDLVVDFE